VKVSKTLLHTPRRGEILHVFEEYRTTGGFLGVVLGENEKSGGGSSSAFGNGKATPGGPTVKDFLDMDFPLI